MITRTKQPVFDDRVSLPSGYDLDKVSKEGTYKVSKYVINGKSYDGTLVVLPWDKLYYRQIFYTIENKSPNPIFTRVRVNLTHPWKEWELMDNTRQEYNLNTDGTSEIIINNYIKLLIQNNMIFVAVEGKFKGSAVALYVDLPEYISKLIKRVDGTTLDKPAIGANLQITRTQGYYSQVASWNAFNETEVKLISETPNRLYVVISLPDANNEYFISARTFLVI